MLTIKYIYFLLLIFCNLHASRTVFIIIHGTWGLTTQWYTPEGNFFNALEENVQKENTSVIPFSWNGANNYKDRNKAAQNLSKLIDSYDSTTSIIVIGHSHGGNVALLASHLLKKNTIFCLYTLGTPICKTWYPNMNTIHYCYNLFSFEDLIQPVLGIFEREHEPHERIANIRIIINGKEPDHSGLHDPLVASWLPKLHDIIINSDIQMTKPGILHFTNTQIPVYYHDTQRERLLERDRQLSLLILNSFRKSINQSQSFLIKSII